MARSREQQRQAKTVRSREQQKQVVRNRMQRQHRLTRTARIRSRQGTQAVRTRPQHLQTETVRAAHRKHSKEADVNGSY